MRPQTTEKDLLSSPLAGLVVAIVATLLVLGRYFWVLEMRPAHQQEIAKTFGSARLFFGTPQVNNAGTMLTYVATDDYGYSIFLKDLVSGERKTVFQENGLGGLGDQLDIGVGPWSPDDQNFIYRAEDKLHVTFLLSFENPETIDIPPKHVIDIAWINTTEIACLTNKCVLMFKRSGEKKWVPKCYPQTENVSCLQVLSDHQFCWIQNNSIYKADISPTNNALEIQAFYKNFRPSTNGLVLWVDGSVLQGSNKMDLSSIDDLSPCQNHLNSVGETAFWNSPSSPGNLSGLGTIHFKSSSNTNKPSYFRSKGDFQVSGNEPRTIIALWRRENKKSQMNISVGDSFSKRHAWQISDGYKNFTMTDGSQSAETTLDPLPRKWNIIESTYDGEYLKHYVTGTNISERFSRLHTAQKPIEFASDSDGDIAELLIYNRCLDNDERQAVENYLSNKWLRSLTLATPNPVIWCNNHLGGSIASFRYLKSSGRLLIQQAAHGEDTVFQLSMRQNEVDKALNDMTNAVSVFKGKGITSIEWIDEANFACGYKDSSKPGIAVLDLYGHLKNEILNGNTINWFKPLAGKNQLVFMGTPEKELCTGIWAADVDLNKTNISPIVRGVDFTSPYADAVTPTNCTMTTPDGTALNCIVYPPPNCQKSKKYPLIIGNTVYGVAVKGAHGRLWVPGVASCGAFVVIIDRKGWMNGIENWEDNVRFVLNKYKNNENIDENNVYLFGSSAETRFMSGCLAKTPGLWKGAIYLNPTGLPDFSGSPYFEHRPKILISVGGDEGMDSRLKTYQTNAINYGIMVELLVHNGEKHHVVGNVAQLDRAKAIIDFVFN